MEIRSRASDKFIDALKRVREEACTGRIRKPEYGICVNVALGTVPFSTEWDTRIGLMEEAIECWPLIYKEAGHREGIRFPIGGEVEYLKKNLWEHGTVQFNRRLSLLNHMINYYEDIDYGD